MRNGESHGTFSAALTKNCRQFAYLSADTQEAAAKIVGRELVIRQRKVGDPVMIEINQCSPISQRDAGLRVNHLRMRAW